ncbi:MAG: hypothetical protein IH628_13645 [Proteobacteria bacterium]|nr:hypothetical protein [Pseudomonadota bacterium]
MSALDFSLVGLYLIAILEVGFVLGRRASKHIESHFLGGPSMPWWALEEYLQDWLAWINNGTADLVIPQVYRHSFEEYRTALASQAADSPGAKPETYLIVSGVLLNLANHVMPEQYLSATLELNRRLGYRGEVGFLYEGIRKNNDCVAKFLLSTYYGDRAQLPFTTRFSP